LYLGLISQWPHGLRSGSEAVCLLGMGSNPAGGMDVCLFGLVCVVR